MNEKNFPQAIKEIENRTEEIYFISQQLGKTVTMTVMKASSNYIATLSDLSEIAQRELPVYIRLISTYIFTGKTATLS